MYINKQRIAYVFPGQGVQFSGMGASLYEQSDVARRLYDTADEVLGWKLTEKMFRGRDVDLMDTRVTQPAVFVNSMAEYATRLHQVALPFAVAGHSLGEYTALVAAGVLTFEDGLRLVEARAEAMHKAATGINGTMASVIGLPDNVVERLCEEMEGLYVANYNCPGHVVVAGTQEIIDAAEDIFREKGAKRFVQLDISVAAHSPYMEQAQSQLAEVIEKTTFSKPESPIYQNIDGNQYSDVATIKQNLIEQMTHPVRWTDTIRQMKNDGIIEFREFGAEDVLTKIIERI